MKLESWSVRPISLPALGRKRPVGELRDGRDVGDVPAEPEQEERHGHPGDALEPGEPERRERHQQQAGDLARPAAELVDQLADHEHERVHADDVEADHGEHVRLVVPVVDHEVAGQVHHRDHARRSSRPRRRARSARPGGGRSRGAAPARPRRRRVEVQLAGDRARIGPDEQHEHEPDDHDPRRGDPRARRAPRCRAPSRRRAAGRRAGRARRRRGRRRGRRRSRARGARADTCRPPRRGRAGSSPARRRRARSRRRRSRPTRPRSRAPSSGSRRCPATQPPASTGIRPCRSISRPAGSAASGAGGEEDRRPEPEDPLDPGDEHERDRRRPRPRAGPSRRATSASPRAGSCCGGSGSSPPPRAYEAFGDASAGASPSEGHVQGVFFRETTRRRALAAGVPAGFGTQPDGSVEAVFEGEREAVERSGRFVREGPRGARVDWVDVESEEPEGLTASRSAELSARGRRPCRPARPAGRRAC